MPFHFVTTIQKIDLRYFLCFDRTNKSYVLKGIVKFSLLNLIFSLAEVSRRKSAPELLF